MSMEASHARPAPLALRGVARVAVPVVALALAGLSAVVNLREGCRTGDTPYIPICGTESQELAERVARSRERIAASPGAASAYVQLALDQGGANRSSLAAARLLAPHDPNVLMMTALAAVQRQDWPAAAAPLVELSERHTHAPAAVMLAHLVAGGQGAVLTPHLHPRNSWLPLVLQELGRAYGGLQQAIPLLAEAMKRDALDPALLPTYIRSLKEAGAWGDAYSLWLALNRGNAPLLYNASFDQPLFANGFDWEPADPHTSGRTGVVIERVGAAGRGSVLEMRLTGRALPVPLLRQHLFIAPGRYRLTGEYLGSPLRMDHGLAWAVRCMGPQRSLVGRSDALPDTAGSWRGFSFDFTVPESCGLVASLELETFAAYEAVIGARGRVTFDALSLAKVTGGI